MTGEDSQPGPVEWPDELTPDIRAGEYVLGTLGAAEREETRAMLADPVFASLVRGWECRLGELHALADSIEPPPELWGAIRARLPDTAQAAPMRLPEIPQLPRRRPPRPSPPQVIALNKQVARWRTVATVAAAVAAVFALLIITSRVAPTLLPDFLRPEPQVVAQPVDSTAPSPRFVAVLQRAPAVPAFILTVDIASRTLTVRRVAVEPEPGKSYELWLVSDRFPAPRSLGVVGGNDFTQSNNLSAYDTATISDATFAISLEPEGGSRSGVPSKVMFAGTLVESIPSPGGPEAR